MQKWKHLQPLHSIIVPVNHIIQKFQLNCHCSKFKVIALTISKGSKTHGPKGWTRSRKKSIFSTGKVEKQLTIRWYKCVVSWCMLFSTRGKYKIEQHPACGQIAVCNPSPSYTYHQHKRQNTYRSGLLNFKRV